MMPHGAKHSKEQGSDVRCLQACATPATPDGSLVAGAGVSGSSPLVGSLEYAFSEVVIVVGRLIREGWTRYRWECSLNVDREKSPMAEGLRRRAPSA
jgi:hypothetical protein